MTTRRDALRGLLAGLAAAPLGRASGATDESKRVAPYAATEDGVAEAMLDLAQVRAGDHVVDLGCGDGRIVLAAARRGATGLGVDIDGQLIDLANRLAQQQGLAGRARFLQQDLFDTDLAPATVVTIYLFPTIMARVAEKLQASLRPGTRVVSHDFALPGWRPQRLELVEAPGKRDAIGTSLARLYLYVVPAAGEAGSSPR